MRKILSVVLAVVMLAAMFVMPINAAEEMGLVITEINVDSSYIGKDGSFFRDSSPNDAFEFVEVYNASSEEINLYDYSFAYSDKADATSFKKFTPIMSGNICTSATNVKYNNTGFYPSNPREAIVKPGETAIIWLYTAEAYSVAVLSYAHQYGSVGGRKTADGGPENSAGTRLPTTSHHIDKSILPAYNKGGVPVEYFYDYFGIKAGTTIVAIDANAVISDETIDVNGVTGNETNGGHAWFKDAASVAKWAPKSDAGNAEKYAGPNGAASAKTDVLSEKYPSAKGRFQLDNEEGTLAVVKTEKFVAEKALDTLTVADAECYVSYTHKGVQDKTYNYTYTEGNKAGQLFAWNLATPGAVLQGQDLALAVVGYRVAPSVAIEPLFDLRDTLEAANTTYETGDYLYINDFNEKSDVPFEGKVADYADYIFSGNYANINKLIKWVDDGNGEGHLEAAYNANGLVGTYIQLISAEDMIERNSVKDANGNIVANNMYADFILSYDIKYLAPSAGGTAISTTGRYASVIFNYDRKLSYDVFAVTEGGYGVSFNRYAASFSTSDEGSAFYAGNMDEAGQPSIINKITNGKVLCGYLAPANHAMYKDAARMYQFADEVAAPNNNGYAHVDVYFNWETGVEAYVNGVKVSEATSNEYAEHALAKEKFGLGIYLAPGTNAALDNIGMMYVDAEDADNVDLIMSNLINAVATGGTEPATGDATLYVVVAMAVAFVALAAVVVIKRKKVND